VVCGYIERERKKGKRGEERREGKKKSAQMLK
jgi:hypothetical protein